MAFLPTQSLREYEVKMIPDVGNVIVDYVLAPDVSQRNCTLKDVRQCDEW